MHILFSQKGFAYDFEFLHAFLSNKKIRFWVDSMQSACAMGKRGPPLADAYFFLFFDYIMGTMSKGVMKIEKFPHVEISIWCQYFPYK